MRNYIKTTVLIVMLTSVLLLPAMPAAGKADSQAADQANRLATSKLAPQELKLTPCEKFAYSTEEDFVTQGPEPPDGNPIISDGDLLSDDCYVCARNADLVAVFDVNPAMDLGLDAADVVDGESSILAFSTELDSPNNAPPIIQFTAGDLLILNGASGSLVGSVIPNLALTDRFSLGYDIGLDGVHFVGEKSQVIDFLKSIEGRSRDDWPDPGELAELLSEYEIDIWFSTEGTAPTVQNPAFLDGDLLSAASGTIIARNSDLLPTSVPAGIPTRGVDFGLDAVTSSRIVSRRNIRFSTEILYENRISFTDGDVLEYGTGVIAYTNWDLIDCFEPKATFLGLDALHMDLEPEQVDVPFITDIGHVATGDINGGTVPIGDPGTGLGNVTGYDRPFGNWVTIHGNIPAATYEFRVVYREAGTARPVDPSTATNVPTPADWHSDKQFGFFCGIVWIPRTSTTDGWFNAADYLDLKTDPCSADTALTVWYSPNAPDPDGHYVVWLQWRTLADPLTIVEEAVDHHVQFDNTAPKILGLDIPGGACTDYVTTNMPITPTASFTDTHFWRYRLRIFGGDPPDAHNYSIVPYDADPDVGPTGTSGYADLHPVDVNDLSSVVDCCYGIRLWVEDRTIIGSFVEEKDQTPWGFGFEDALEITFSYDAP
jgi:hypothetical protein